MTRFLHTLLVCVVIATSSGVASAALAALHGDECGDDCEETGACPDEGADETCPPFCSYCPCGSLVLTGDVGVDVATDLASPVNALANASTRLPDDPPPRGVFHPPRPVL